MTSKHLIAATAGFFCAFGAMAAEDKAANDGFTAEMGQRISEAGQAALQQIREELEGSMRLELRLSPLTELRALLGQSPTSERM